MYWYFNNLGDGHLQSQVWLLKGHSNEVVEMSDWSVNTNTNTSNPSQESTIYIFKHVTIHLIDEVIFVIIKIF